MLHISVIGSCRVHNPVSVLHTRQLAHVNSGSLRAYAHQTRDCLQQLKIREGLMTIPEGVSELAFTQPVPPSRQAAIMNLFPPHETDVAVIEICTLKVYGFDGLFTQDNHCKHYIADRLNSAEDAAKWWWEIGRTERNQGVIDSLLPGKLSPAMAEAARHMRLTFQTPDEIMAGMKEIAALIKIPVLWVSHNRLCTETGERIEQRDVVAAAVHEGADALGHRYLDPTPIIEGFGQEYAMEDGGKDLNEYTKEFMPFYGAIILDELKNLLGRS